MGDGGGRDGDAFIKHPGPLFDGKSTNRSLLNLADRTPFLPYSSVQGRVSSLDLTGSDTIDLSSLPVESCELTLHYFLWTESSKFNLCNYEHEDLRCLLHIYKESPPRATKCFRPSASVRPSPAGAEEERDAKWVILHQTDADGRRGERLP